VTAATGQLRDDISSADDAVFEAPSVLRIVWADPQHMAEQLAVWSLARFGPRAGSAVGTLRARHPGTDRDGLERLVIERQMHVAMTEGAFVGGPFILLIPVAFCAALLAQAQMVFELAAAAGHEPNDQMRAAELLVLLGAYGSTADASAALAAITRDPRGHDGQRFPAGTRWAMVRRMAYLLGLLGGDETRSRLRSAVGWAGIGVIFLVGLVLPLVWVPYMAYSNRRSTLRLAVRARAFYGAEQASDAGIIVRTRPVVQFGGTAALVRTVLLVALPIVAALVALLTDFSFGNGHWIAAGVLLLGLSGLSTLGWLGYKRWRRRRQAERLAGRA
jgi:hypothetical protein